MASLSTSKMASLAVTILLLLVACQVDAKIKIKRRSLVPDYTIDNKLNPNEPHSRVRRSETGKSASVERALEVLGEDNPFKPTVLGRDKTPKVYTDIIPAILTVSVFVGSIIGIIIKQKHDEKVQAEKDAQPIGDEKADAQGGSWFKKISAEKKKKRTGLMGVIGQKPSLAVKAFSNMQKKKMAKYKLYEDMLATYAQSLRIQKANTLKKQRLESLKSTPTIEVEGETKGDKAERLRQLAMAHSAVSAKMPTASFTGEVTTPSPDTMMELQFGRKASGVSSDEVFAQEEAHSQRRRSSSSKPSVGFADEQPQARSGSAFGITIQEADHSDEESDGEPVDISSLVSAKAQISFKPTIKINKPARKPAPEEIEMSASVSASVKSPKKKIEIEEEELVESVNVAVEESAPELPEWDEPAAASPEVPKSDMMVSMDGKKKSHTVVTISSKSDKKEEKKGILSNILGSSPKSKRKEKEPEKSVDELIQDEMVAAILSRLPDEEEEETQVKKHKIKLGPAVAEDEIEETIMRHEEAGVELDDAEAYFSKEDAAAKIKSEEKEALLLEKEGDSPSKTVVTMRMKERPSSGLFSKKRFSQSPLASTENVSKKIPSRPQSQIVDVPRNDEDPVTELFAKLMDLPEKKASPHGSKGSLGGKKGSRPSSLRGSAVKLVMDSAIASAVAGDEQALEARCMSADSALKPPLRKKRSEKDVERMLKEVERRMIATIHSDIDFEESEVVALESLLDEVSKYCSSYVENWSDTQGRRAATFTEANQELAKSADAHDSAAKKRLSKGSPKMGKK